MKGAAHVCFGWIGYVPNTLYMYNLNNTIDTIDSIVWQDVW
jgi:hypothetical protein